ncbi:hypothetical protein ACOMHN_050974 [Nucella lapillus]
MLTLYVAVLVVLCGCPAVDVMAAPRQLDNPGPLQLRGEGGEGGGADDYNLPSEDILQAIQSGIYTNPGKKSTLGGQGLTPEVQGSTECIKAILRLSAPTQQHFGPYGQRLKEALMRCQTGTA